MELETHYDALIKAEHQKLKQLRTRPWALSLKLFGKGEAEAKAWVFKVGYTMLFAGYLVAFAVGLYIWHLAGRNVDWVGAGLLFGSGTVVSLFVGWIGIEGVVFPVLKEHDICPACSKDMLEITEAAQKYEWFREVVEELLAREGAEQVTQLQATALLYHLRRILEWCRLEAVRSVGLSTLEEKTGVVGRARLKGRSLQLDQALPSASTPVDRRARF